MPEVIINFDNAPIYEVAAQVLTILMFSGPNDTDDIRGHVRMSLCAWAIHRRAELDAQWGEELQAMRPVYAIWPTKEVDRDMARINRRMRSRMTAGRMAMVFLKKAHHGEVPRVTPPLKRLSINQVAEWALPDSGLTDTANVKSRAWRPSLPVLHLAAAAEFVRQMYEKAGQPLSYDDLLWQPLPLQLMLAEAATYEALFAKLTVEGTLRLDLDTLIRIRAGPGLGSNPS